MYGLYEAVRNTSDDRVGSARFQFIQCLCLFTEITIAIGFGFGFYFSHRFTAHFTLYVRYSTSFAFMLHSSSPRYPCRDGFQVYAVLVVPSEIVGHK